MRITVLPLISFKRLLFVAKLVDLCRRSIYMFLKIVKYISLGNPGRTRKFQLPLVSKMLPRVNCIMYSSASRAQDVTVGIDPMWGGYHSSQLPWLELILIGFRER